jgi:hypothetical protein
MRGQECECIRGMMLCSLGIIVHGQNEDCKNPESNHGLVQTSHISPEHTDHKDNIREL